MLDQGGPKTLERDSPLRDLEVTGSIPVSPRVLEELRKSRNDSL
jgi:hypothetical protein